MRIMSTVYFVTVNQDEKLILAEAEISEKQREDGFHTDSAFIPPYAICDDEASGMELLRKIIEEVSPPN